ncbi:MAG: HAD family hydrolase [Candidatus Bipolaricaulaceae bacterium]
MLFDLDGTLVRYRGVDFESSWGALGVAAGVQQAWDELLARYLGQPDRYEDWVRENAALLAGVAVADVNSQLFPLPYADGAAKAVAELRRAGALLGVVSSGVGLVARRAKEELGLDFAVANQLEVRDGRFTGAAVLRVGLWDKLGVVKECGRRFGFSLSEAAFVGDHLNDIPVLRCVGWGVAYRPKAPAVQAAARLVTEEFADIPSLLLGLRSS